jgi:hypothetical protein
MAFNTLTFKRDSQPYTDFLAARRALQWTMGNLEDAREENYLEEVSKWTRAVSAATEKFEDAFKNLDEEVHVVTAHGVILFYSVGKMRVDDFMVRVRESMCCERARTRFGVETYSRPATDVQLTEQQFLYMVNYLTHIDSCEKFIKTVKSVIVCECKTPYERRVEYPVNPFSQWY